MKDSQLDKPQIMATKRFRYDMGITKKTLSCDDKS